jgi:hypothetical protein
MIRHLLIAFVFGAGPLAAQEPLDRADVDVRRYQALLALDRYLETWNSQEPARWAASLHYPHIRPGPGAFGLSATAEEYAAGVDFAQTRATGWHHSEWVARTVFQVGADKVHVAGEWRRYSVDGNPMIGSLITYVVTEQDGRWGVQSRFAAGRSGLEADAEAANAAAALDALEAYFAAWNGNDPGELADMQHYPHVRLGDGVVEISRSVEEFLAGAEPGRQRTWYETRLDRAEVVQVAPTGVNITIDYSRRGRDGGVFSRYEALFLVVERDGVWKVQAVSTLGP